MRLLALLAIASSASAQSITVGRSGDISRDEPNSTFGETWIAVNPRNPGNVIASGIRLGHSRWQSIPYSSADGGATWTRGKVPKDMSIPFNGDPVVSFDGDGVAYFSLIGVPENLGGGGTGFGTSVLRRSMDGGKTWSRATPVGVIRDREYQVSDMTGGPMQGRLYLAGSGRLWGPAGKEVRTIGLAFSDDKGASFIGMTTSMRDTGWSRGDFLDGLLVTPVGQLVLLATRGFVDADSAYAAEIVSRVSKDGGISLGPIVLGPTYRRGWPGDNVSGIAVAIDRSEGPYRGRVYVAAASVDSGVPRTEASGRRGIRVMHSDDLGATWSPLRRVSDSVPNAPMNPAIAVNRDGIVGVTWNDRRDDPKADCFRVYFTASLDGGDTFLPNVTPTRKWTCANDAVNWVPVASSAQYPRDGKWPAELSVGVIAGRFTTGGDTQGLDAGGDGVFHSAWINGEQGPMHLWHTTYRVTGSHRRASTPASRIDTAVELRPMLQTVVGDLSLDLDRRSMSASLALRNVGWTSVTGPFTLVLDSLTSSLASIHATNATCGGTEKGASWIIGAQGQRLGQRQTTQPVVTKWAFTGTVPPSRADPLHASFSILKGNQCQR
jgi:hypothetical protein